MGTGLAWMSFIEPRTYRHARQTIADLGAEIVLRDILHVEWAEHGGFSAAVWLLAVLCRHEGGQAQCVREKDEFLARRRTDLAYCGQEFDAFSHSGSVSLVSRAKT